MGRLEGKTAIVTGGATGIGEASARLFAAEGAHVFVANRRAELGEAVAEDIRESGGVATFVRTDVTDPASVADLFAKVATDAPQLDIVFNVVGISGRRFGDGPIDECTEDGWDVTMDTNARSMFLMCRGAIPALRLAGGGSIINMGSVLGISPAATLFGTHAYAASKGALNELTRGLAVELARYNITANTIIPGWIATGMTENTFANPRFEENVLKRIPFRRWGEPDDFGGLAVYLMSDASAYHSGDEFVIDGAYTKF